MTNYFSFHLSSRMIPSDCTIVRHEITDWEWIIKLISDAIPVVSTFDIPAIKAVKEICGVDIEIQSPTVLNPADLNPTALKLCDGDSLIVAEVNNLSSLEDGVITGKVTNEDSYINFIKYNVSYFGDDDKQRLDELEYIKSSIEDIDIF